MVVKTTKRWILDLLSKIGMSITDVDSEGLFFVHGTVTADWTVDSATAKTAPADKDIWITSLTVSSNDDPTAEIATQPIALRVILWQTTDSKYLASAILAIPNNTQLIFPTPIKVPAGKQYETKVYLGGATNTDVTIMLHGYYLDTTLS